MKQIFSKIFLLLALATTGFATTACDENTINQVLNILNQLNQGEQLYFTGSSTVMHCVWNEKNNQYEYQPSTGVASFKSHGLNMSVSSLSGQAAIAIGDFTVEGITVSNLDLPAVTYSNGTIGDASGEMAYGVQATLKQNGQTTTINNTPSDTALYPCAVVNGTVASAGSIKLNVQIFLSEAEYINIEYSGTAITQ